MIRIRPGRDTEPGIVRIRPGRAGQQRTVPVRLGRRGDIRFEQHLPVVKPHVATGRLPGFAKPVTPVIKENGDSRAGPRSHVRRTASAVAPAAEKKQSRLSFPIQRPVPAPRTANQSAVKQASAEIADSTPVRASDPRFAMTTPFPLVPSREHAPPSASKPLGRLAGDIDGSLPEENDHAADSSSRAPRMTSTAAPATEKNQPRLSFAVQRPVPAPRKAKPTRSQLRSGETTDSNPRGVGKAGYAAAAPKQPEQTPQAAANPPLRLPEAKEPHARQQEIRRPLSADGERYLEVWYGERQVFQKRQPAVTPMPQRFVESPTAELSDTSTISRQETPGSTPRASVGTVDTDPASSSAAAASASEKNETRFSLPIQRPVPAPRKANPSRPQSESGKTAESNRLEQPASQEQSPKTAPKPPRRLPEAKDVHSLQQVPRGLLNAEGQRNLEVSYGNRQVYQPRRPAITLMPEPLTELPTAGIPGTSPILDSATFPARVQSQAGVPTWLLPATPDAGPARWTVERHSAPSEMRSERGPRASVKAIEADLQAVRPATFDDSLLHESEPADRFPQSTDVNPSDGASAAPFSAAGTTDHGTTDEAAVGDGDLTMGLSRLLGMHRHIIWSLGATILGMFVGVATMFLLLVLAMRLLKIGQQQPLCNVSVVNGDGADRYGSTFAVHADHGMSERNLTGDETLHDVQAGRQVDPQPAARPGFAKRIVKRALQGTEHEPATELAKPQHGHESMMEDILRQNLALKDQHIPAQRMED